MTKWIGVIIGESSHQVLATIVPDNEAQLDNPRWLLMHKSDNEPIRMIKMLYDDFLMTRLSGSEVTTEVKDEDGEIHQHTAFVFPVEDNVRALIAAKA